MPKDKQPAPHQQAASGNGRRAHHGDAMSQHTSVFWRLKQPVRWCEKTSQKIVRTLKNIYRLYAQLGGIFPLMRGIFYLWKESPKGTIKRKIIQTLRIHNAYPSKNLGAAPDLYSRRIKYDPSFAPKITVIVPNYNHEPYLRQRLESIYSQSYKNFEVILLDDCSTDDSQKILCEFAEKFPDKTRLCFNEKNSGGVFHQWRRGLALATGALVWIAESDDYCTLNFLEEMVRFFVDDAVMLAYCRTDFVKGPQARCVWTTEEYLSGLPYNCWAKKQPFIRSAHWAVNHGWAIRNIVPNASSALFRHPGDLSNLNMNIQEWTGLRLCGDWMLYLSLIRGGLVAYSPGATNYYRQHEQSTSLDTQKRDTYYKEFEIITRHLIASYQLLDGVLDIQQQHLRQHWKDTRGDQPLKDLWQLYDQERAKKNAGIRKKNIVMAAFALISGGGETFPIFLANILKAHGYAVTLFNFRQRETETGIHRMIAPGIPVLEIEDLVMVEPIFKDFGIEITHSHHASIDLTLATILTESPEISQIVTTHGMYEMMSASQLRHIIPQLQKSVARMVYTADKNLAPFPEAFRQEKHFVRINNALPLLPITPASRGSLGIGDEDFVLCMVARAIPEKGWQEAIEAILLADREAKRRVHLVLIGDGREAERLKKIHVEDNIHFIGFRQNIRDYFAMADMGFLPSRFKGESFPLVLIDCLHAGKPFLASNIGEIGDMLHTENGDAGVLFDLRDGRIPVKELADLIVRLADDKAAYHSVLDCVATAAHKFDPVVMFMRYDEVYESCDALQTGSVEQAA